MKDKLIDDIYMANCTGNSLKHFIIAYNDAYSSIEVCDGGATCCCILKSFNWIVPNLDSCNRKIKVQFMVHLLKQVNTMSINFYSNLILDFNEY